VFIGPYSHEQFSWQISSHDTWRNINENTIVIVFPVVTESSYSTEPRWSTTNIHVLNKLNYKLRDPIFSQTVNEYNCPCLKIVTNSQRKGSSLDSGERNNQMFKQIFPFIWQIYKLRHGEALDWISNKHTLKASLLA
jgi:hypothetical protein